MISAAEIASYDHYKETIIKHGLMTDNTPCHLTCAAGAGLTACIFGSPLDVLTTRQMNEPGRYKGVIDVVRVTISEGGLLALYKGFIPNACRLAGFNMAMWFCIE